MDYDEFVTRVAAAFDGDRPEAERATRATLETLAERIGKDEAVKLVPILGPRLGALVHTDSAPQSFDVDEFLSRVAAREQVGEASAERHATVVLAVLSQTLDDLEYERVRSRLPADYTALLPKGAWAQPKAIGSAESFVAAVAERAGIDQQVAARIADAALETLAERVAPGQVHDLMGQLPVRLHTPLRRGLTRNPGRATPMPVDDFVARVAYRAKVRPAQARAYSRAVFDVLRDTVTDEEFFDLTAQVPDVYWGLQASP